MIARCLGIFKAQSYRRPIACRRFDVMRVGPARHVKDLRRSFFKKSVADVFAHAGHTWRGECLSSVKRTMGLEHMRALAVAVLAISGYMRIGRASADRSPFPVARFSRQRKLIATVLLAAQRGRIPYSPAWRVFRSVVGHSCTPSRRRPLPKWSAGCRRLRRQPRSIQRRGVGSRREERPAHA